MPTVSRVRRIIVTGAGSGIGKAIADRLVAAGHTVVGTVRGAERARALSDAARAAGVRLEFLPLDLSSPGEIASVAGQVTEGGGIDVLVNNAGFGLFGAVEDGAAEEVVRQMTVNLLGPIELTRLLLPALRSRKGRIIWIGSLAGRQSLAFQGHYSVSKAGVAAISDALRMELRPLGVQVTCVEPGDIATGFTDARVSVAASSEVYGPRAARSRAAVEREERGAPGPACVARVVEHLVMCRHLPTRVPVGRLSRTTSVFLRVAPHAVAQFMARRRYRI